MTSQEFVSLYQSNPRPISNEEKANEIVRCDCKTHYKGFSICNSGKFQEKYYCPSKAAALKAMQWKDEYYKKLLDLLVESGADANIITNYIENCIEL